MVLLYAVEVGYRTEDPSSRRSNIIRVLCLEHNNDQSAHPAERRATVSVGQLLAQAHMVLPPHTGTTGIFVLVVVNGSK